MKRMDLEQWRAREVARLLALVEAERRYYQEIAAMLPVGVAVLDAEMTFISANQTFREVFRDVFGQTERPLAKFRLTDLFPGGEVNDRIAEVLHKEAGRQTLTVQYVSQEGPRTVRLAIQPFRGWDEEASPEVILAVQDLEAGPRDAIVAAGPGEGSLLKNIDAIVWERDATSLRFLSVGGRVDEMLGYPAEEWTGPEGFDERRIHPEDRDWVTAFYRAAISSSGSRSCEYRALRSDGQSVWLRDVFRVVRDEQGSPVKLSGITVDINTQKIRDEQLVQAEKMAALGRLAGKITHDCNNLLMIVSGYSEELLEKLGQENSSRTDVEEIIAAAERLSGVTSELLHFTRRPSLSPRVFSLNALLESFEPGIRRELGDAISMEIRTESPAGATSADWDQIGDAILTLARHARGAMPEGGRLIIETGQVEFAGAGPQEGGGLSSGRYVTLSLTDSGPALDAETQTRLFEPFFSSRTTGEDLPALYTLIRNSGGDIRVSRGPEGGTRYTVYLPYVERPTAAPAPKVAAPAAPPPAPSAMETILLAEDEEGIRTLVRKILTKKGYTVLEASEGEDALKTAEGHPRAIDLLLTDVVMPGISGRELTERLRAKQPDLKVLYISGYTGDDLAENGSLPEGAAFLQKPFSLAALLDTVRAVLDT